LDTNLPPNPAEAVADLKRFFSLMRVLHALASRGDGLDVPLDEATAQLATSFRTALLRRFVETRCAGSGITLDLAALCGRPGGAQRFSQPFHANNIDAITQEQSCCDRRLTAGAMRSRCGALVPSWLSTGPYGCVPTMMAELWASGLPKRPSRGERRQATCPQRGR
jgi:hypothetical protein